MQDLSLTLEMTYMSIAYIPTQRQHKMGNDLCAFEARDYQAIRNRSMESR